MLDNVETPPGPGDADDLIGKWRRGHEALEPVVVDGDVMYTHLADVLGLAHSYGLPNVFIKAGRPIEAPTGSSFIPLTHRNMTSRDVESIAKLLWRSESVLTEMLQGKALDLRYDLARPHDGSYLMFRGNMSKLDGVGANNYNISLRSFPSMPPPWEKLGIEPAITRNLLPDRGLILWVGKTDSGKTTLQASAINYIARRAAFPINCIEYGEPLEYPQNDAKFERFRYMGINLGVDLRAPPDWRRGNVAYACRHSLRNAPGLVAISECRDGFDFEGVVEAALAGTRTMTTAHTNGPPDTFNRMVQSVDPAVREAFASNLLSALRVIVHQRLIPSAAGGRTGMREYMIFTKDHKRRIQEHPLHEWSRVIEDIMAEPDPDHVQTFPQHLSRLLSAGEITQRAHDEAVGQLAFLE